MSRLVITVAALMVTNDLWVVREALSRLAQEGIDAWLFGGLAEELRGFARSRPTCEIELLCRAESFDWVDCVVALPDFQEIPGRRFPHSRAFELDGVMVSLTLVRCDRAAPHTIFFGRWRHDWPDDVFDEVDGLPVAGAAALRSYRARYPVLRHAPVV